LINEHSASASELLAGALQFHKRATVVGTPSFGKGSVQKMYTSDTEALKLTVGQFTAGDHTISKKHPVNPDVYVTQTHSDPKIELEQRIQQSSLTSTEKTVMTQYLSQLSSEEGIAPIPWHKDFDIRIDMDPVLQHGWSAVQP
jgi:C-terminal processing protease CtpA/Prc